MNTKTKRAMLLSLCSILLCVSMLIGSTFAWFTDSKATNVNQIQAGTLTIDLQDEAGNSVVGKTIDFKKAAGHESEPLLWEPGCTYDLNGFKVVNTGNLAVKYKVLVNGIGGAEKLNEAIEWTYNGQPALAAEFTLLPGAASDVISIQGHMKETAGNEYQGLSINGASVSVLATQYTYEFDSTTDQYDKNAAYTTFADLQTALQNGGSVVVGASNYYPVPTTGGSGLRPVMTVTKDLNLTLDGVLQPDPALTSGSISGVPVMMAITSPVTVNIGGNGGVNAEAGDNSSYAINLNNAGATLNITGGSYLGAPTGIQVQAGTLNVSGGFFDMSPSCKVAAPQLANYEINCIDTNFTNGTAKINVTGGTFVNFDPSANPEGAGTSYVAPGYKVVSEAHGADTWYKVVPV